MSATRRVNLVAIAVLLCSMAGAMASLFVIEHQRSNSAAQEALYLRSSKVLRRLSLGYTGLLADIYWTRAVQYFGEQHHSGSGDFRLLAPLLEVTTELDPKLLPAYQFGAIFWRRSRPAARACGRGPRADAIWNRTQSDQWRLYYNLDFCTTRVEGLRQGGRCV